MKHITYHELALHDVPRAIVDHDIHIFVTHELFQIQNERNLPGSWPGEDKIRIITTRADGFFIYAATVCRYVTEVFDYGFTFTYTQFYWDATFCDRHGLCRPSLYSYVFLSEMQISAALRCVKLYSGIRALLL